MNYFNLCTKIIINIMIVDNNSFYSIAPMMGKTDSFFCYLMKIINNKTFDQLINYQTSIKANYMIITNGKKTICFTINKKELKLLKKIPVYKKI